MTIYEMKATFGKLEHSTLTLRPGLNVIEAPNEWGTSTWCAFLVAMLYGIDTRERTTLDALADKEHYMPWSGSPMSGRIDLGWNGKDITIERTSRGRSIFGIFRAYETATGLDIPELTAENCGQMLLGVEKNVFLRSGFIKLTDLPVKQDEQLRRRLNALVTTGDETGASDALADKLHDLKNQCRANRAKGLIPKAEAQRQELQDKLSQIERLRAQCHTIRARQQALSEENEALQNHQAALAYAQASDCAQKAQSAKLHLVNLTEQVNQLEVSCAQLELPAKLQENLSKLQSLREAREALQMRAQMRPVLPNAPQIPPAFRGYTADEALAQARADSAQYEKLCNDWKKPTLVPLLCGIAGVLLGAVLAQFSFGMIAALLIVAGIMVGAFGFYLYRSGCAKNAQIGQQIEKLHLRYQGISPDRWIALAEEYQKEQSGYDQQILQYNQTGADLQMQLQDINEKMQILTEGASWVQKEQQWKDALDQHKALSDARAQKQSAEQLLDSLGAQREMPCAPAYPDTLTYTPQQTAQLLAEVQAELTQAGKMLANYEGQMGALGVEQTLKEQLEAVNNRLARLEETFEALELAENMLQEASNALQRRFAPRISRRTQELFGKMTKSRYDRLILGEDLSLSAGAQGEDTLHGTMWRSDGTADQLYLALRLAVAEELTPHAPLVLDDALVRFDDTRLASALDILQESAESKQVIVFTCQSRERALMENRS